MSIQIKNIKRSLIRQFPVLKPIQLFLYRFKPRRLKFQTYYNQNGWGELESKSGRGSTLKATEEVRKALPAIFEKYKVQKFLDSPCGDFFWMQHVDLSKLNYHGYDIVPQIIKDNKQKNTSPHLTFDVRDIIKDPIEQFDLILVRDCFIHFPFKMIIKSLKNLKASGSTYILTTHLPSLKKNEEIASMGLYRPINLMLPPFSFPKPELEIPEPSWGGVLGLWKFSDILIQ